MTFEQALQLTNQNRHLIGQTYRGATLDEIIIFPTNPDSNDVFKQVYISTGNAQHAITPFMAEDVHVAVVADKRRIVNQGIFLATNIENLIDELDVNLLENL